MGEDGVVDSIRFLWEYVFI